MVAKSKSSLLIDIASVLGGIWLTLTYAQDTNADYALVDLLIGLGLIIFGLFDLLRLFFINKSNEE